MQDDPVSVSVARLISIPTIRTLGSVGVGLLKVSSPSMYVRRGRESADPPPSSLGKGVRGEPLVDRGDYGDKPLCVRWEGTGSLLGKPRGLAG